MTDDAKEPYMLLNELQHNLVDAQCRVLDAQIIAAKPNVSEHTNGLLCLKLSPVKNQIHCFGEPLLLDICSLFDAITVDGIFFLFPRQDQLGSLLMYKTKTTEIAITIGETTEPAISTMPPQSGGPCHWMSKANLSSKPRRREGCFLKVSLVNFAHCLCVQLE